MKSEEYDENENKQFSRFFDENNEEYFLHLPNNIKKSYQSESRTYTYK
jgi:hypothetical protein